MLTIFSGDLWKCIICSIQNIKPGLHLRRKHKRTHKRKHKDVYTCDEHKHKVTYASVEAKKCSTIARLDSILARDLIAMYAENLSLFFSFLSLRLFLCLRRCVVCVNRDDASISTSASTRRLCLRCKHKFTRRFLVLLLVFTLMLSSHV